MSLDTVNSVAIAVGFLALLVVFKVIQTIGHTAEQADHNSSQALGMAFGAQLGLMEVQKRIEQLEASQPKAERPARIKPGKADKVEPVVAA